MASGGGLLILVLLFFAVFRKKRCVDVRFRQQQHLPSNAGSSLVIDIISTGSTERYDYVLTQRETFGRHASIRNFWVLTEANDTDARCATQLTKQDINMIIDFCNATYISSSHYGNLLRQTLFRPKGRRNTSAGWLCAQQRPVTGLNIAIQWYRRQKETKSLNNSGVLPHYLIFIDDDTYLHMDKLIATMQQHIPYSQTHLAAGCKYESPPKFSYPYGGFATILTQPSLQQLMFQPIRCSTDDENLFRHLACQSLRENRVGEARFFQEGMTVADLMIQFTVQQPFTKIRSWEAFGFCFHSDHLLAYFLNFYHIGVPFHDPHYQQSSRQRLTEQQRYRHGIQPLDKCADECANQGEQCMVAAAAKICHTMTPHQMLYLYDRERTK